MPLPAELLKPIEGPNPSGTNLRYTLYDKVKEARREEAVPPPGMSEQDRKVADNALVVKLTTQALGSQTKDLWLAAWLTEARVKQQGFPGLLDGLALCQGLIDGFWDSLYPEVEDGDLELRSAALEFVGSALDVVLTNVPLVTKDSYGFAQYKFAREPVSGGKQEDREKAIKAHTAVLEAFDRCFEETPKQFYADTERALDGCLEATERLKLSCEARFPDVDVRPSMFKLYETLQKIRHVVHGLLQRKREKEPDPVQDAPAAPAADDSGTLAPGLAVAPAPAGVLFALETSSEPADRLDSIRRIAEAAAFLRRREPHSPAPYLMLRGLRWGELRAAIDQSDPAALEAPPTELRRRLKKLALDRNWVDLLDVAENAMALPCSRAWLDLQRMVVEACDALGSDYAAIARAIRSGLRALVIDIPQLLDATLMDDTPVANAETRAWLKSMSEETPIPSGTGATPAPASSNGFGPRWPGAPTDMHAAALQALRAGQERKAFEIMQQDIARQRSGRERFRRKLQMVEMCIAANKPNIAQPILDDLAADIEAHKLDDWEDPAMVAAVLSILRKSSKKVLADQGQQQKLFERICRLDPAQVVGDEK